MAMRLHLGYAKMTRLIFLIFFCCPFSLIAQWGSPVKLSIHGISASLNENAGPCLAVSGDTLHVVWSDHRTLGYAIYYERSIDTGKTWSSAIPITDTTKQGTMPAIAVSGSTVHVVWMDNSTGQRVSLYKRSLDGGNTWGPVVWLDSISEFWPGIAASGTVVYATLNKSVATGNSEVFLRRSLDNGVTWEPTQQISNATGRSEDPSIAVQGSYVHLVWNDNRNGNMQIYYRRSTDWGVTWGPETSLINGGAMSYCPMICLNNSNADVPCGDTRYGNYDIFLKQSDDYGTTWGTEQRLTSDLNSDVYPYMVRDASKIHIVYDQFSQGGWYLYSGDGGASWDSSVYIGDGLQFFIGYTGCILHVIWSDSGSIYYKRNPTGNCGPAGIGNIASEKTRVLVYPDPFTSEAKMCLQSHARIDNAIVKVFDFLGREVLSKPFGNDQTILLSKNKLSIGLYFYKVLQEKKIIATGKFTIE